MIISHKYQFIFIKTQKTAGTSIEIFLSPRCGPEDVFTPIHPHVEPHVARNYGDFFNHIPAWEVREKVPRAIWDNYMKFCVERNPWDKMLSYYHMMNFRRGGKLKFDELLAKKEFCRSYPLYTDRARTQIIVDRVLRYESLAEELGELFGKLGVPFSGVLDVYAKAEYRRDRRPYQEVYTSAQRDIVAKAFAWEIERHGYRF